MSKSSGKNILEPEAKTIQPQKIHNPLKPHELETILFLRSKGFVVAIIAPSLTPRNKTPDILLNNVAWEMKSPTTEKKTTIKRLLKDANQQSPNIVVDLRRAKISESLSIPILLREYKLRKATKKLIIIKKDGSFLHYEK